MFYAVVAILHVTVVAIVIWNIQLCSNCTQGPVSSLFNLKNDDTGMTIQAPV